MNMEWFWVIAKTVLILAAIAFVLGALLGLAGKIFAVKKDEREEKVLASLPGANCGACGFAGCAAYAAAVVEEGIPTNKCVPGGAEVADSLSAIMGTSAAAGERMRAEIMCSGCEGVAKYKYKYKGMMNCSSVTRLGKGSKECPFGCIGLGECVQECPFGAIKLENGMAKVIPEACKGCGVCVSVCPQHIIRLVPFVSEVFVCCSNTEKGAITRKYCEKGCIGCRLCEKTCPSSAIKVENNLAVIDYSLCTGCGACAEKCPRHLILKGKKDDLPTEKPLLG